MRKLLIIFLVSTAIQAKGSGPPGHDSKELVPVRNLPLHRRHSIANLGDARHLSRSVENLLSPIPGAEEPAEEMRFFFDELYTTCASRAHYILKQDDIKLHRMLSYSVVKALENKNPHINSEALFELVVKLFDKHKGLNSYQQYEIVKNTIASFTLLHQNYGLPKYQLLRTILVVIDTATINNVNIQALTIHLLSVILEKDFKFDHAFLLIVQRLAWRTADLQVDVLRPYLFNILKRCARDS